MSLWRTEASCLRQQHTVRQPTVGQAMHRGWHKIGIRVCRAPLDERIGGVRQQNLAKGVEEKARESQRDLGGGGAQDSVGLPHHAPIFHHGDGF